MIISLGEIKMKKYLDQLLPNEVFIDNYRPDWLKNPATGFNLELDRYCPNLKVGFEYNGFQHRKKHDVKQWERDKLKRKLCGKHKVIRVVVYKNDLTLEIIKSKINDCHEMRKAWTDGRSWRRKK